MNPTVASAVGVAALLAVLGFAILRPKGLPEVVAAVPAVGLVLLLQLATLDQAWESVRTMVPTLAFLAATLLIAHLADVDGVFRWLGSQMAAGSRGSAQRLLVLVFAAAALTTALLSLDATVVLLTPAIMATVNRLRMRPAPHLYASAHLSNSASLLLPVSNLTNLLAFHAAGTSFVSFTALMALPWLAAVAVEYGAFRVFFTDDLSAEPSRAEPSTGASPYRSGRGTPTVSLIALALILAGFAISPLFDVEAVWVAAVGAAAMSVRALVVGQIGVLMIVRELNVPFLLFVASLSVVVVGATSHGIQAAVSGFLPSGTDLWALLAMAAIAAALANMVNNLPATLLLLAALGPHPTAGLVLAMLIGVNIGPNLTYTGSLATLLWRRVLIRSGRLPSLGRFTRLGLLTVPLCVLAATSALWLALRAWADAGLEGSV